MAKPVPVEKVDESPAVFMFFDENRDPNPPKPLKMRKILEAANFLKGKVVYTPIKPSFHFKNRGYNIHYKLEALQKSGSCKDRGILYTLDQLKLQQKKLGIIMASIGNAAVALCLYAARQKIRVTVVMPETSSVHKRKVCADYGATVLVFGHSLPDAQIYALAIAQEKDLVYISGRDHPNILTGNATIGLEILEQMPKVDAILIPLGSGGLAAGIATVIKKLKPQCKIYGIQTEEMPVYANAIYSGGQTITPMAPTMAEELAMTRVGVNSFNILNKPNVLDKLVTVNERCLGRAIVHIMEFERFVAEASAAAPLAAIIGNYVPELKFKKVVCLITGGNVDLFCYARSIQRGLAADGRIVNFTVHVPETVDGQLNFFELLESNGFNVLNHSQRRRWLKGTTYYTELLVSCPTKNIEDALRLKRLVDINLPYAAFEPEPFNNKRACPCYQKKKMPL